MRGCEGVVRGLRGVVRVLWGVVRKGGTSPSYNSARSKKVKISCKSDQY